MLLCIKWAWSCNLCFTSYSGLPVYNGYPVLTKIVTFAFASYQLPVFVSFTCSTVVSSLIKIVKFQVYPSCGCQIQWKCQLACLAAL